MILLSTLLHLFKSYIIFDMMFLNVFEQETLKGIYFDCFYRVSHLKFMVLDSDFCTSLYAKTDVWV